MKTRNIILTCVFWLVLPSAAIADSIVSFEILNFNPVCYQGDLLVVRACPGNEKNVFIIVFSKIYRFNEKGLAFVGIDMEQKPGKYVICAMNLDKPDSRQTINFEVIQKDYITNLRNFIILEPSEQQKKRRSAEIATMQMAYAKADTEQSLIDGKFNLPLSEISITDEFGVRRKFVIISSRGVKRGTYINRHRGTDFRASEGTPVVAINSGKIILAAQDFSGEGNMVIIDHGLGTFSFYMHLLKFKVLEGQMVQKGQIVGLAGKTGYVTGPHLHLMIKINNAVVDPLKFIEIANRYL